jgi:hypothetical protein
MGELRRFEVSFIYEVCVDEGKLYQRWVGITDEDREDTKQLLRAALQKEDVANYLLVREIAFDLADIGGGEDMPEILTGYGIDDHTPVLAALDVLPIEKRQRFSGGDGQYIVNIFQGTLNATLDHVHVRSLQAHEHVPPLRHEDPTPVVPPSATKQRHHKRKPGKKK